jgi:hypothetical protein
MFNVLFQPAKKPEQTPKEKETKAERTRYNLKLFYKICSIFDNKE